MPGDPWRHSALEPDPMSAKWKFPEPSGGDMEPDTTYVCVVDSEGNAFSATPSDGMSWGRRFPNWVLVVWVGGSGVAGSGPAPTWLREAALRVLRSSPGMVTRDGRLVHAYGTPGGDVQPRRCCSFLINFIDFRYQHAGVRWRRRAARPIAFLGSTYPRRMSPG